MTLGQIRNAIDAMIQRGEFSPNLPASVLFPNYLIHEDSKANPQTEDTNERTT